MYFGCRGAWVEQVATARGVTWCGANQVSGASCMPLCVAEMSRLFHYQYMAKTRIMAHYLLCYC